MAEPCEGCGHPVELREHGKWWERFNTHHWIEHDPERLGSEGWVEAVAADDGWARPVVGSVAVDQRGDPR